MNSYTIALVIPLLIVCVSYLLADLKFAARLIYRKRELPRRIEKYCPSFGEGILAIVLVILGLLVLSGATVYFGISVTEEEPEIQTMPFQESKLVGALLIWLAAYYSLSKEVSLIVRTKTRNFFLALIGGCKRRLK